MRVLFVFSIEDAGPDRRRPLRENIQRPLGISYIAAVLSAHGHAVDVVVLTRRDSVRRLAEAIRCWQPQVVGFTSITAEYPFIAQVAQAIRLRFPGLYLVLGGIHPTLNAEPGMLTIFDALCVGEGEFPMLELVEQLAARRRLRGVPNMWIRSGDGVSRTAPREFVDPDTLPMPLYSMWDRWVSDLHSRGAVLVARGCHYRCTYCIHAPVRRIAAGTYVRCRSPDGIVEEIAHVTERYHSREVYLEGEMLNVHLGWALELCRALERFNGKRLAPITFGANIRPWKGGGRDELFRALARCGFRFVTIGVESGSERVRREVLHREYRNEDVAQCVELARRHGLGVGFQIMVGIPSETRTEFRETIRLTRTCQPDWSFLSVCEAYPGIELYDWCKRMGWPVSEPGRRLARDHAAGDLPGFSRREIDVAVRWFDYHVYRGYRSAPLVLAAVVARSMAANPATRRLLRFLMSSRGGRWLRTKWDAYKNYGRGPADSLRSLA